MIGIFDSGLGGLTILRALAARFPRCDFTYLGDQANVPYGNKSSGEIVALTSAGLHYLFDQGCSLVLLGCNTATAVAARRLQREWLPATSWAEARILGIVAPTVEAATQTPWAVTTPQYPQKNNTDTIAVFGTARTISSNVYSEEIAKRCPKVRVVQRTCATLAGAIENGWSDARLERVVAADVAALSVELENAAPDRVILGCTHFPLVEQHFRNHLPAGTRILSQPRIVADSLEDYLARHPRFASDRAQPLVNMRTTGAPVRADELARIFWPDCPRFERA